MINIVKKRNCVYQAAYHIVCCTKYRKPVLKNKILYRCFELIDAICKKNNWVVISQEIQADHIHLFISFFPAESISHVVKNLKGITARKLFIEFSCLKKELYNGSLWSPSYYAGTVGNVSAKTIKNYIERTDHTKKRR